MDPCRCGPRPAAFRDQSLVPREHLLESGLASVDLGFKVLDVSFEFGNLGLQVRDPVLEQFVLGPELGDGGMAVRVSVVDVAPSFRVGRGASIGVVGVGGHGGR